LSRLRAGERTTFEWLHLRSNGTEFPSEVRLVALPSAEGCQIRSSVVDITQRKEQEQQLREQERALARVSRLSTMGEMVAGIAHEINQPLFSIRNFSFACTNVLRQGGDHIPSTLQYMKEIERQSDRASEIMKRLADFVRHKQPRRSTVDVNQLTNDAIELLAFEAQRWNVNVHRELRRPSRSILADVVQIQQVLVNLLRNAYEALHANTPGNRNVFVRTSFHGDEVTIDVADNGPGFVDDVAGKLFETFFSTKDQGMGMGLAIARSIIKEHGGSLRAYRREDGGATFSVNLVAESEQFNEV
jgi:two-component system sensor kinase FixL